MFGLDISKDAFARLYALSNHKNQLLLNAGIERMVLGILDRKDTSSKLKSLNGPYHLWFYSPWFDLWWRIGGIGTLIKKRPTQPNLYPKTYLFMAIAFKRIFIRISGKTLSPINPIPKSVKFFLWVTSHGCINTRSNIFIFL